MFAKLTAFVGGGYTFPYNVEEPYPVAWGQWTHHQGTSKDDGSPVSIFKMSAVDPNDRRLAIARNGVKRLKMVEDPGAEVQEKGQTVVYLVTQSVKPLKQLLEELNLTGQHREEYLAMGILHMTNAVSFLNNDCKLIHGNICLDSVVVTETLDWKLHGFDLLSEHSLPTDHCLMHASWMVGAQYKPGELGKSDWDTIRDSPPWAVDAWGLGCLIQEVFSQESLTSVDNLRRTSVIPSALLGDYQKLLSSNPGRRLNPSKVAESRCLNNRLVDVVNFMENIAVKDATDKDTFFKRMGNAVPSIPPALAVRKILPQLSHALEFGGAPPSAVGPLLQIGGTLESDDFNKRVVPTLSKLFTLPDRALRRSLLESLDTYVQHLTTPVLEEQIYIHLQTGFTDANAYIRELTLKSILSLAPKLSNKTLVNNVLKHLSKLQVDEEASIRANTTVLLGNIAKYLGEATCKRVLLNAFTRALKDGFPPAKIAGLRAMIATQQYHNAEDAALRIIPATAPLSLDPIPEVRSAAIQVLDIFVGVLKDADSKRAHELAASGEAAMGSGGSGMGMSMVGAQATLAGSAAAAGSSMLTWAVSNIMSSTGLAVKAGGGPATGTATAQAPPAAAASAGSASGPTATKPPTATGTTMSTRPSSGASSSTGVAVAPSKAPASQASSSGAGDGWGDGDGWDEEMHVDPAEAAARQRLSAASTSNKTTTKTATTGAATSTQSRPGGGGWDGLEEAGGWEGMETPAPAPTTTTTRPRPARPASGSGTSGGGSAGGAKKPGGMKLGVQKLSASKAPDLMNFDEKNW